MGIAQHMNTDLCHEQVPWVRMAAKRSMQPPPTGFMKMVMLVTRVFRVLGVTSHPLLALTLTSSPVLILSFCQTNIAAIYSPFFWFCPDTFPCSIQKASVSPSKVVPQELSFPHSANIPPKKSKFTLLHWKPGKEGLNGSPDSLAGRQGPHVFTLKSCFQFSSVTQSCPTLCDPMNCSTPGLSVHHQLPEFTQTHIHRVHDAIQPSHPQSSPSPPAPNSSQHQSLFQWVNSLHEVAKVLELQL